MKKLKRFVQCIKFEIKDQLIYNIRWQVGTLFRPVTRELDRFFLTKIVGLVRPSDYHEKTARLAELSTINVFQRELDEEEINEHNRLADYVWPYSTGIYAFMFWHPIRMFKFWFWLLGVYKPKRYTGFEKHKLSVDK